MCGVLSGLCRTAVALLAAGLAGSVCHAADAPIVLENDRVLLEIDPAFGTIARILDKSSGIDLAPAQGLAENFRLVLLMPDKKTATILGKDQKLSGSQPHCRRPRAKLERPAEGHGGRGTQDRRADGREGRRQRVCSSGCTSTTAPPARSRRLGIR